MKKKIFACAVLGAFSGVACAQSAPVISSTNVILYGMVDIGYAFENNGTGPNNRLDSGNLNGSRIGVKGSEDLGGGLSAIFQLENGFATDNGTLGQSGALFGRHSWVGLSSSYGAVKLGRQILPVYDNADIFDPFADSLAGDTARMFNYSGIRVNNSVSYTYATSNGFKGEIMTGLGEVPGNNAASRTVAGYGLYKQGPIQAVLTYTKINDVTGNDGARTTLVGGNYDFGPLKGFVSYAWNKGTGTLNTRDALIGVAVPVTAAGTFLASVIYKKDKFSDHSNASQTAIGYIHNLSKRTALYTSLGYNKNDSRVNYNAATPGASDKLFNIGVRHIF